MRDLNDFFDKAARQKEIVALLEIDEILSLKRQHAESPHNAFYSLFRRKPLAFATVTIVTMLLLSLIGLQVADEINRVDQEVFIPQAQRRVMHLVKNISDCPDNQGIKASQFGADANRVTTGIRIHLRSKFELAEDQLNLLGITFADTLIKFEGNVKGKGYLRLSVPKAAAEAPFFDSRVLIGPTRVGVKEYEFYPWFLTNDDGLQGSRYQFGGRDPAGKMTNSFFLNAIDELIPIEVNRPGFEKSNFLVFTNPGADEYSGVGGHGFKKYRSTGRSQH